MGGIPPSRDTVWRDRDVDEEDFGDRWERAFGQRGPNRELKLRTRDSGKRRHYLKMRGEHGED
jgi:hypothetical protein